jgi:dTDP-6-deoxy-L-talose 4-dehydrogenase (NAD+)
VRDYVHVDDAASSFLTLLREGASGVFNVCSGEPMTVRGIMETIGEELHKTDLLRFGAMPPRQFEPPFICGDCSRLKQLGWRPVYSLREGLRSVIEHWRAKGARS